MRRDLLGTSTWFTNRPFNNRNLLQLYHEFSVIFVHH
uniref:Uncharacterized protein n=1 Tax=Rhizophora mucronata TaxID=61149 RepID=A0A2P2P4Y0_RHIMU